MSDVVVVHYGAGNTRSVTAALRRRGWTATISDDPARVAQAARVVLPGVGSAGAAMTHLRRTGVADALRERARAQRFTLGICLGMQLLVESSDEDEGVTTLGVLPGRVTRLTEGRVPRLGWSMVEPWGVPMYFAHSFAVTGAPTLATSEGVTAAVGAGAVLGVQFHPEKSGPVGERWLAQCLSNA